MGLLRYEFTLVSLLRYEFTLVGLLRYEFTLVGLLRYWYNIVGFVIISALFRFDHELDNAITVCAFRIIPE